MNDSEYPEGLGDPGKKALDAMKAKLHAERDIRQRVEAKLRAAEAANRKLSGLLLKVAEEHPELLIRDLVEAVAR